MERSEQTNPWAMLPNEIEDILFKEVFTKLGWDDILTLSVCKVNKAWRTLFTKNSLWKSFLQTNLPFVDIANTTEYHKKFIDTWKSYQQIQCGHPLERAETRICPCLFPLRFERGPDYTMYYTGYKNEYFIKLDECQCHDKIWTNEYLQFPLICKTCFIQLKNTVYRFIKRGLPELFRRPNCGTWMRKELNLVEEILVAKPLPNSHNLVAITKNEPKKLVILKLSDINIEQEDLIECTGDSLQISNDGKYVAVYTRLGTQGFLYNLHDRIKGFAFEREDYYLNHCSFPIAFLTYENKEYFIAGKMWNRIVLYDPDNGAPLKDQISTQGFRDFFWNPLYVSPDQRNMCSFGWFWGPIGVCYNFSIDKWMKNDDTPDKEKELSEGEYWDYPICWLDNNTIAVWGDSVLGSETALPVVRSININTPETTDVERRPLFVPLEESPIVFDEFLFSLNPKGIEVVDVSDSHVLDLHNQREVSQVLCYNKHTKQVMSIKKDQPNVLVLSHIQFNNDNKL